MKRLLLLSVLLSATAFANEPDLSRDEVFDCVASSEELYNRGEEIDRKQRELDRIDRDITAQETTARIWAGNVRLARQNYQMCTTQYFCQQAINNERNAVARYNSIVNNIDNLVDRWNRINRERNNEVDRYNSLLKKTKRRCDNRTMRKNDLNDACRNKGHVSFCKNPNR